MSRNTPELRDDQDGVRVFSTGRGTPIAVIVVAFAALAAVSVLYLARDRGVGDPAASSVSEPVAGKPIGAAATHRLRNSQPASVVERSKASRRAAIPERRADGQPINVAEADRETDDEAVDSDSSSLDDLARGLIETLGAPGQGGLAAFPPPGTNPVKTGIIVPDTFELPEGYVRYHQTTDDGKRLEPILMFSPDYEFTDPDGAPIAIPEDGIVPADMAPPGLPVRMLDVPDVPRAPAPTR